MKTQIKSVIAALLLGVATYSNANTSPNLPVNKPFATGIYKSDGKPTLNINIDKMKGAKVAITLTDSDGAIIFEDLMYKKDTYYRTKINMVNLKKGTYSLEIYDGVNKEVKKIEI
jgi:Secretion system C-terminal sorting domain